MLKRNTPLKKNTKNINNSVSEDKGFIMVYGKPYKVNQDMPDMEFIKKCRLLTNPQHMDKEIERYNSMIRLIEKKQDELLKKDNTDMLKEIYALQEQKKSYIYEVGNILDKLSDTIYGLLDWLLGNEAVKIVKEKKLSYENLINVLYEASGQNKVIKLKMDA